MATFPGKSDLRSAPYSRFYTNPAAVNLTTEVEQARCATSGLTLVATAAASGLTYKDSSGTSVVIAGVADGTVLHLPIGAIELTSSATMLVIAYWHPSNAR